MAQMIFSWIQQVPGPDSRKVGKSLYVYEVSTIIIIKEANVKTNKIHPQIEWDVKKQ